VAVWGRPSYVLPVWRHVIINTTERILTGPVTRPIPTILFCSHSMSGALSVRTHNIFYLELDIPMAVTDRTCEAMSGWHSATAGSRVGATSILVAYGVAGLIGESGLAGEWSAVGKSA